MDQDPASTGSPPKHVVAFLGPVSSYSHQASPAPGGLGAGGDAHADPHSVSLTHDGTRSSAAADREGVFKATLSQFPASEWTLQPVVTIKDVFEAVQAGQAEYGVVPFENSTHGPVSFTLDCLADREGALASLSVCAEIYLDVHHFLLGRRAPSPPSDDAAAAASSSPDGGSGTRARPLAPLGHVRRVYSHPQAFGQTGAFMGAHLRGVDAVDVTSTSRAAQLAAEDPTGASAAVAGEMAARVHGLDVLARCIEDREDNTTRFFVLRRGAGGPPAPGGGPAGAAAEGAGEAAKTKTLVSFTVPHQSPGALADVLDVLRKHGLNLTSINSVPSLIRPFQYLFLIEFEGSRHQDPEGRVEGAFAEVDRFARRWRWLGSWENRRP